MNETGSELRGWTRRNFLKAAGVAGCATLFPWLAYAAESDELNAKADETRRLRLPRSRLKPTK